MWLRLVILFYGLNVSSALWAQTEDGMLSNDGRNFLHQIYHPQEEQKEGDLKASEYIYLTAYRYFIEFISFEQDSSAAHFMDTYDRFSEFPSVQENQITQLMLVNLSIQKGLIQWMKGEQLLGTFPFIKGYRLLNRNYYTNPSLLQEVRKLRGLFLILIDQLPDYMMSGANLFGLEGNRTEGFSLLQEYVEYCEDKEGVYAEALVLYGYCLMKFSNGDKDQMHQFIQKASLNESPLLTFVSASVAIKKRDGETARSLLDGLLTESLNCFPLLHYLKGKAALNRLSPECEVPLTDFLKKYPGNSFKTDALWRLACYYRLMDNQTKMEAYLSLVEALDHLPTSLDKQAIGEVMDVRDKPRSLIRGRLLFDNGQVDQCIKILEHEKVIDLPLFYRAEWHYRMARAKDVNRSYKEALFHYDRVMDLCEEDNRYIGPYSALYAAEISYHSLCDSTQTRRYLKKAGQLNTGQYKSSIRWRLSQFTE